MSKPMIDAGSDLLDRPFAETSEESIHRLFLDAAKPTDEWYVGTELELFGFHRSNLMPPSLDELQAVLEQLGNRLGWRADREADGMLTGLKGDGQAVSLEPGGQLEFATRPHRALRALRDEMTAYCDQLRGVARDRDLGFWCLGHQPFVDLGNVPRMPKARYDRMRGFLSGRGARALEMMHLTCSIQCTVDFSDEANLTDKVRTAVRASPFLSALVAASPFTRGRPNGYKSLRYQIWLETDDDRCGVWPEMFDAEGLRVHRYIARAVAVAPMFFMRNGDHRPVEPRPFAHYAREGFEGTPVTVRDFIDHLTTMFPEVRLKGYVELRGADCLPPAYATAISGFWRAILDDEATRRAVDERLAAMDYEAVRALQPQVAKLGLEADSAAGPVLDVARWLVDVGYRRMKEGAPDCAECLEPLVSLADDGYAPADRMIETALRRSVEDALAPYEV